MNKLARKNKDLKYSLFIPDIYQEVLHNKEFTVSTMDEYLALKDKINKHLDSFEKKLTENETKPNI